MISQSNVWCFTTYRDWRQSHRHERFVIIIRNNHFVAQILTIHYHLLLYLLYFIYIKFKIYFIYIKSFYIYYITWTSKQICEVRKVESLFPLYRWAKWGWCSLGQWHPPTCLEREAVWNLLTPSPSPITAPSPPTTGVPFTQGVSSSVVSDYLWPHGL